MKMTTRHISIVKIIIHGVNLFTLGYLILQAMNDQLGGDPVPVITHFTGKAALNLLLLSLIITPLAKWGKMPMLFRCRRALGLYCFFWTCLHLLTYLGLNLTFDFSFFGEEIINRPYLTLGAICWLILFALSITSITLIRDSMGKYWQYLHNWVYLVLILAPIHYYWSVKSEVIEPSIYLVIAFILLLFRKDKFIKRLKKNN